MKCIRVKKMRKKQRQRIRSERYKDMRPHIFDKCVAMIPYFALGLGEETLEMLRAKRVAVVMAKGGASAKDAAKTFKRIAHSGYTLAQFAKRVKVHETTTGRFKA